MTLHKSSPKSFKSLIDAEMAKFEAALLRSVDQAQRGNAAAEYTPK